MCVDASFICFLRTSPGSSWLHLSHSGFSLSFAFTKIAPDSSLLSSIEWISYIVLDLGLDAVESLPPGLRALTGLFQSFAIRASGFAIVSLSALAPSFQSVPLALTAHLDPLTYGTAQISVRHPHVYRRVPSRDEHPIHQRLRRTKSRCV